MKSIDLFMGLNHYGEAENRKNFAVETERKINVFEVITHTRSIE